MLKRSFVMALMCLTLAAAPAWGLDLNPGLYEITVKVKMAGMPGEMPPQTSTQCITKQDPVPTSSAGAQGCNITDMKTEGNTVFYTMECVQQGMKIQSKGKTTYSGDSFEGTTETNMGPSAGNMTMTTTITGKRIGECK